MRRIKLIDKFGNIKHIIRRGKMATSNLDTIMTAIDKRAQRFVDTARLEELRMEELISEAIDETGTIGAIPSAMEERLLQATFTKTRVRGSERGR